MWRLAAWLLGRRATARRKIPLVQQLHVIGEQTQSIAILNRGFEVAVSSVQKDVAADLLDGYSNSLNDLAHCIAILPFHTGDRCRSRIEIV